jgi:hypothetical protein
MKILAPSKRGPLAKQGGNFWTWKRRAKHFQEAKKPEFVRFCQQKAYLASDDPGLSFFQFSKDICGRKYDSDRRLEFHPFITKPHRFKMLQAARGSWKSSVCCVDFSAWLIARDWFLNEGESNLRIAVASEVLALAQRNVRSILRLMRRAEYLYLAGDHKSTARHQKPWGITGAISDFRPDAGLMDPTLMPIAINTETTGFHFDYILGDDVEAERSSATREMIENVLDYIRLLYSILDPNGTFHLLCTRWHEHDAYAQIEKENQFILRNPKNPRL